jgi:aspartyl-tRNA(Asn)/glutamyl-tRNA(Gln) amidotransferase subunit A
MTITELGRALRAGELGVTEVTEHFLARIEALDDRLNAFRVVAADRARAQARAAETLLATGVDLGPLHGIPYAAKDLFDVAGLPTTGGTSVLADRVARESCPVVRRLDAAGAVLLGKTNTVQFAYGGAGVNHDHGTPHNPWHETPHLPGGSSSGSGVAVAAGLAAFALGTDTGGSVRIPASLCGVTGLKTTVGRISRTGIYPLSFSLDSVGPLARDATDAALVYEALRAEDVGDPTTLGQPAQDTLADLERGAPGLRVALAESPSFWDDADPEVAAAVRASLDAFERLGARVSRVPFGAADEARRLNPRGLVIAAEAHMFNRELLETRYDELDPIVATRMLEGGKVSATDYLQATFAWREARAEACSSLADIDVLLCPATAIAARPVAEVDADLDTYTAYNVLYLRNTAIGNILDLCGISVPCGRTGEGLPIGLMLYAKPFAEEVALRAARAFQDASDFHRAEPDLGWAAGR